MAEQKKYGKWIVRRTIGATSGQARVYEVFDGSGLLDDSQTRNLVMQAFERLAVGIAHEEEDAKRGIEQLRAFVLDAVAPERRKGFALKAIKSRKAKARARLEQEVSILRKLQHPSLIPIIDANVDEGWFVTTMYRGTLSEHLQDYRGDALALLTAIRPIVQAVALLHSNSVVHRDIKPDNIFMLSLMQMVLGDFGIAFELKEDDDDRLTDTLERVGSRDWMPPWAAYGRIENVTPAFDVYTLGKVIWAMAVGETRLPYRYGMDQRFDISTAHFPEEHAGILDEIVRSTVADTTSGTLPHATGVLTLVDDAIARLIKGFQKVKEANRQCLVCGKGRYEMLSDLNLNRQQNFGLNAVGQAKFKILICSHCAHVQLFYFRDGETPDAWR